MRLPPPTSVAASTRRLHASRLGQRGDQQATCSRCRTLAVRSFTTGVHRPSDTATMATPPNNRTETGRELTLREELKLRGIESWGEERLRRRDEERERKAQHPPVRIDIRRETLWPPRAPR